MTHFLKSDFSKRLRSDHQVSRINGQKKIVATHFSKWCELFLKLLNSSEIIDKTFNFHDFCGFENDFVSSHVSVHNASDLC